MKIRRLRTKPCYACRQEHEVLFRARAGDGQPWRFYCRPCLLQLKSDSPSYNYGGTWKSKKRH